MKLNSELLDKLISEQIDHLCVGKPLKEAEGDKGGIKSDKGKPVKKFSNFDLGLREIMGILSIGTETEKIRVSTLNATKQYLDSYGFQAKYTSAKDLVESFRVFDLNSEEIKRLRCSSLGGLMSKYAIISGLVSIMEQFNAQAAGFVNEAFISLLLGGKTVPVGTGGIEDLVVDADGEAIGISLKTKKATKLGGSLLNLTETLNIPTFTQTRGENKALRDIAGKRKGRIFKTTQVDFRQTTKANPLILVNPARQPDEMLSALYYLVFVKDGSKLSIHAAKVTAKDIIANARAIEVDGVIYYDYNKLNNILAQKPSDLDVVDKHSMPLEADYSYDSFNKSLAESAKDVFTSLSVLDDWFGQLKSKIANYVSSLERDAFSGMQDHMSSGNDFAFNAFDTAACAKEQVAENNEKITHDLLDKMVQEVILE